MPKQGKRSIDFASLVASGKLLSICKIRCCTKSVLPLVSHLKHPTCFFVSLMHHHCGQTWRNPQNRKYNTYCNAPSMHGHRQHA